MVGRKDFRDQDPNAARSVVYVKKLVHMEEGGDLLAERAARLIVLGFAQSRLVGSLNEVLVDRDKLAVGSVGCAITRIAPRTMRSATATRIPIRYTVASSAGSLPAIDSKPSRNGHRRSRRSRPPMSQRYCNGFPVPAES